MANRSRTPKRISRPQDPRVEEFRAALVTEIKKLGTSVPEEPLEKLCEHYRLLLKWSRAVRLVGSVQPEEVVRRHVLQSLALVPYVAEPRGSLLDIGSGNGFPALPVKCLLPDLRVRLVEPTRRKSLFLEHAAAQMRLSDTEVLRARVDRGRDLVRLGKWDTITMRAVAAIPAVMEASGETLRPGGRVLLLVGGQGRRHALDLLVPPMRLAAECVPPLAHESHLLVFELGPQHSAPS